VSALDNLVHYDRKYPPDFATAENCVVMQSLHLLSWLMTTCHIILVVQVGTRKSRPTTLVEKKSPPPKKKEKKKEKVFST
jgi:hypothetical protein